MAFKQQGDVSIKVGKYTDGQGNERGRYVRVGVEYLKDDGSTLLALDASCLSPSLLMQIQAGGGEISRPIFLSVFRREERNGGGQRQAAPKQAAASANTPPEEFNDDIPF